MCKAFHLPARARWRIAHFMHHQTSLISLWINLQLIGAPMFAFPQPLAHRSTCATISFTLIALCACASGEKKADTAAAAGTMPPTSGTMGAAPMDSAATINSQSGSSGGSGGMQGMANMTGDPDHDFLRMMSDHHKGLIQLAHMTKEKKDVGTAAQDATKLDTKQDEELDHMVTMLEKDFKDPYAPKVMPEHQKMADELKAKSRKDYERLFYQDIIKHHQEAVKMVDAYLPTGKNTMLKGMAETMKADQQKEIREFQQKVAKLGA